MEDDANGDGSTIRRVLGAHQSDQRSTQCVVFRPRVEDEHPQAGFQRVRQAPWFRQSGRVGFDRLSGLYRRTGDVGTVGPRATVGADFVRSRGYSCRRFGYADAALNNVSCWRTGGRHCIDDDKRTQRSLDVSRCRITGHIDRICKSSASHNNTQQHHVAGRDTYTLINAQMRAVIQSPACVFACGDFAVSTHSAAPQET